MSKVIPKNVLEDIRAANDIVDVVGSYLQLKRAGSTTKALCPFHKEKTPSFNVNAQRQIYHCFGCGAGGDVFKFVMEYESVDFSTAARMLAERGGIRLEWADTDESGGPAKDSLLKIHEEVALVFHRALLETPGAEKARRYLQEREIDEKTVKDFLIGHAPEGRDVLLRWCRKKKYSVDLFIAAGLIMKSEQGDLYDRFRNRLMFPIRDELGRVIGLDLSQDAIIEACRAESSVLWLIGDLARPPLALGSVDLILNILSPANYPAFQSLLTPDGEVLKVVPAKDHLAELRELAKGSLADREYSNERVLALFEKELLLTEKTEIQKTLPLTREQARDFLYMTPLMQHVDRETIDLSKLTQIRVSAVLLRGRRR